MTGSETILATIETAEVFESPPETPETAVARLASVPHLEYDRLREAEAKNLGIRVSTLDKEVARIRGQTETEDAASQHCSRTAASEQ